MEEKTKKIEVEETKANPKQSLLNDKIEAWYLSTFYNKGIETQLFNHFIKSKEALKASLLELFN
jgi:hypothetical protein